MAAHRAGLPADLCQPREEFPGHRRAQGLEAALRIVHGAQEQQPPHAGEHGMFGTEEAEYITPAIKAAAAEGIECSGPHPADTVFYQAVHRGRFDAIVCMYHDQGHGPMKLLAFDTGVNVTLGLPIVRTSVDHGTAFDIAWTGRAFTDSLHHALAYARKLVIGR